ncbi:MAG: beta-lactamase family protein [Candidatus Aminicenantes bacterium]|nr:beta-lactamase family protein [Candidatus Aminicenantes bacterium]
MKSRIFAALLVCLYLIGAVWAQQPGEQSYSDSPVLPGGVTGERIRSVIDTVNSGDPERVRRFINEDCTGPFKTNIPMDEHVQTLVGFFRQTGGVDFSGIRSYVPERKGETIVIVKDRNLESLWGVTLRFTAGPDALISGIGIGPARPSSALKEAPLTEGQAVEQMKALIDKLIAKGVFSGALLVAKGDKVLLTSAGGEASKAFHVPNNVDTKFNLGSMNKMFTSTAIMRLVGQGKLSLDDPLSKFLDESWLPKSVTEKITIRHLLTHSSGLGSYFNETYDKSSRALFRKLDDYKPLIKDDRPAFEPGSRFQYSNTGMFLLGVIIEKVTGQDYFDYIRKAIYEPAGMTNSDSYEMDVPVENLAIGYSPDPTSPAGWRNNLYAHVIKGGPAGGGFSTVKDLHKFALVLLAGKYVSPESLKMIWTDHLKANYGFGFTVDQGPAGKVVGHSGGFSGINSELDIYLDSGYIIAVMSNVDMGAGPLARKLGQWLARVGPAK